MPISISYRIRNHKFPADENNLLAGAKVYGEHCAVCHGVPDTPKTAIAEGMFPKPPQLFKGMGVTDDDAWESYWKVAGGIRMTGMPGFKDHLSETQMWQVAVLLENADKISPAVRAELASAVGGGSAWLGKEGLIRRLFCICKESSKPIHKQA